jgi:23S rRNA pseudouridine1911/1915/1917 synthase
LTDSYTGGNEIITACQDDNGKRLDSWLSDKVEDISRTHFKQLIVERRVLVNDCPVKPNYKIKTGDVIKIFRPEPQPLQAQPEDIDLNVIYDDDHIIVIDKPRGMVVHPAAGNRAGTLVNALMYHYGDKLSDINGVIRPGIVHRLDKDTSGVMLVAKTNQAHRTLSDKFKGHEIKKIYYAIVDGIVKEDHGKIDAPIGRHPVDRKKMAVNTDKGRNAITHFQVMERLSAATLLKVRLETGRTHQIRVHMAFIGHPIIGDSVYGRKHINKKYGISTQLLHAGLLGFHHPVTGQYMEFKSDMPEHFKEFLEELKNDR